MQEHCSAAEPRLCIWSVQCKLPFIQERIEKRATFVNCHAHCPSPNTMTFTRIPQCSSRYSFSTAKSPSPLRCATFRFISFPFSKTPFFSNSNLSNSNLLAGYTARERIYSKYFFRSSLSTFRTRCSSAPIFLIEFAYPLRETASVLCQASRIFTRSQAQNSGQKA